MPIPDGTCVWRKPIGKTRDEIEKKQSKETKEKVWRFHKHLTSASNIAKINFTSLTTVTRKKWSWRKKMTKKERKGFKKKKRKKNGEEKCE